MHSTSIEQGLGLKRYFTNSINFSLIACLYVLFYFCVNNPLMNYSLANKSCKPERSHGDEKNILADSVRVPSKLFRQ